LSREPRVLYSLHTEYLSNIGMLTALYFNDFSIFECIGYWGGKSERGARIDIIALESDREKVEFLANHIRGVNQQDSVYVVYSPVMLTDVRVRTGQRVA
jgi:hypothetical protein